MVKKVISLTLILTLLLGAFSVCGVNAAAKLIGELSIEQGETNPLKFTDGEGNRVEVVWKSDTPSVASVTSDGMVTAVKPGTAYISTTWGGTEYSVRITVTAKASAKKISLSKTKLSLTVGKKATIKLNNASGKISWSSKNSKIASVKNGTITAKKKGKTTITARHSGKKYNCAVTVKAKKIALSQKSAKILKGAKLNLKLNNAKASKVKWSTSNKKVATVGKNGAVKAKKKGSAKITAKYKGKKYTCKLSVVASLGKPSLSQTSVLLPKGKSVTLKLKNAVGVKWSSTNNKVAAVSGGKVTAKGNGTASIKAVFNKKTYKCSVRVFTQKTLGTKTMTEKTNSTTVSGVKVSLDPSMLKKDSKLTVSEVSGLPKPAGKNVKTYDFSLSGAKVSSKEVAVLEIPQKLSSGEVAFSSYFNEKTQKWEPVFSDYENGKVEIVAQHFSKYAVGTINLKDVVEFSNQFTTQAEVMYYWSMPALKITGADALDNISEALKSAKPTSACVDLGIEAVNTIFDRTINWGANFTGALNLTDKFTSFTGEFTAELGAVGFAISYVQALKYAYDGEHLKAASTAMNGAIGMGTAAAASWIGGATISACCFATTVIGYALNKGYSDMLDANEKKWYEIYKTYYNGSGKRHLYNWRDILGKHIENTKISAEEVQRRIEGEVDSYVNELWNDDAELAILYSDTQKKAWGLKGGLNNALMKKISDNYKQELLDGDVKKVLDWFANKQKGEALSESQDHLYSLMKLINTQFTVNFYDGSATGAKSQLKGCTVGLMYIPDKISDKDKLKVKLNSKGQGKITFTFYSYANYEMKPIIQVTDPMGNPFTSFQTKFEIPTSKIDVANG